MSRRANLRLNVRRVARALHRLASELVSPPTYTDGPSTADWHQPAEPSHPSLLCNCPGARHFHAGFDIEHAPGCTWLKHQCTDCSGSGHCSRCGGDGCDPDPRIDRSECRVCQSPDMGHTGPCRESMRGEPEPAPVPPPTLRSVP